MNIEPGPASPLLVASHAQPAVEDVDRLIEALMSMRDRAGETGRDRDLHGGEPGGLAVMSGQNVHRLARIEEAGALAPGIRNVIVPFYQLPPGAGGAEMRALSRKALPGARYRRHLLWRYSLIWVKPAPARAETTGLPPAG